MIRTIRRIFSFLSKEEKLKYYVLVAFRSLAALIDLLGIVIIGYLAASIALFVADTANPQRLIQIAEVQIPALTAKTLPWAALAVLSLFVFKAIFSIVMTRRLAKLLARVEAKTARMVGNAAFGDSLSSYRRYSQEEIYFAVQTGSPTAFNSVPNALGTVISEGTLFILVILTFFIVDPISALGSILYFVIVAVVTQHFVGSKMHQLSQVINRGAVETASILSSLGSVIREATVLSRRNFYFEKVYKSRLRIATSSANQFVLGGMPRYIVETALVVAVAFFVLLQSGKGDLVNASATLGVFLSGGLRLTASLLPLQSGLLSIKQSVPAAKVAIEILDSSGINNYREDEIFYTQPRSMKKFGLKVILQEIEFSYTNNPTPAVSGLSMEIPPGQQVAIIGPSGSGKSTIADLLLGLIEPNSGHALIEGVRADCYIKLNPGSVAYVPQKPGLVSGSVLENIALGLPNEQIDMAKVNQSIKLAHLEDLIISLPEGLHANLGNRLDAFSGGQLQRIGLARALYSEPSFIVLDEATSSLDAESEFSIRQTLDALRGKVTVVLIAHRLNTIQKADQVFLIEEGKLTDSGTFQELAKRNPRLDRVIELQQISKD